MPSTINADNGVVSGSSGVKTTADTSGVLALQSNGSTGLTLGTDLSVTFAGNLSTSGNYVSSAATGRVTKSNTTGRNVFTGGVTGGTTDGAYILTEGYDYGGTAAGGAIALVTAGASSPISFFINGTEGMRLTGTGLGIGTTSPTYKLDISVTTNNGIRTTSSAGQQLYLGNTGGDGVVGTLNNYAFNLMSNGSPRFQIGTAGQLGIGGATYGTSGQVLTSGGSGAAPTWATASAGAMTFISVQTISGTPSTLDFTSGISSTYDDYVVIFENVAFSAAAAKHLMLFYKSGAYQSENYRSNYIYSNSSSGQVDNTGETTFLVLNRQSTSTGANLRSGIVNLYNLNSTTGWSQSCTWAAQSNGASGTGTDNTITFGGGTNEVAAAVTRLRFQAGSGTFISGTFRLYGIQKS
jgi:hypothetical protein